MAATALLLVLLAACSDDGSDDATSDGGSGGGEASGEATAETEEQLLEWVECMRDQGVDIPDPEVDADGNLGFPEGIQVTGGGGGASIQQAQDTCGNVPEGAASGGGGNRMDQSQFEDTVLEYAQCMRDNGVDMPDPNVDGGRVTFGGPGANIDQNDPAFEEAQAACQDILADLQGGGASAGAG